MKRYLYSNIGQFADLSEWQVVEIQIMRTGQWRHPVYWDFSVNSETIRDVIRNFNENVRGVELAVDENHEGNHIALWWIRELYAEDGDTKLFAKVELTQLWAEKLGRGEYKYFSPEIIRQWVNDETGHEVKNLLVGGAFTNRPYFKGMSPLKFNEDVSNDNENISFYLFNDVSMKKLLELLQSLSSLEKVTADQYSEVKALYDAEADLTDEIKTLFSELDTKLEKEDDQEEDKSGDDQEEDNAEDQEEKKDEDQEEDQDETKTGEFKDPDTWKSYSFSDIKAMEQRLSEIDKAEKQRAVESQVDWFVFSEATKEGILLPKSKTDLVTFAMSLNEDQLKQFCEILWNVKADAVQLFSEVGSSAEAKELNAKEFAEKVDARAREIVKDQNITYGQATIMANKELTK